MGLFDIFRPGKEKKQPSSIADWIESVLPSTFPAKGSEKGGLIQPKAGLPEKAGEKSSRGFFQNLFSDWVPEPGSVQKAPAPPSKMPAEEGSMMDLFSDWTPEARRAEADRLRNAPLWAAVVPRGEEGSLYRSSEVKPPDRQPIVRQAPPQTRNPYDQEAFAKLLPKMFFLDALFDEVHGIRSTAAWRRAVEDSAHTGEPADVNLGEVNFESLFGVSEDTAEDEETDSLLIGMLTAAFEIAKPEEFPGWFQLKWADIGDPRVELAYREVKRRPNMGGLFDFLKKKKMEEPGGLIPLDPTLPARQERKPRGFFEDLFSDWLPSQEGPQALVERVPEQASEQPSKKGFFEDLFSDWMPSSSAPMIPSAETPIAHPPPPAPEQASKGFFKDLFSDWVPEPGSVQKAPAPPSEIAPVEEGSMMDLFSDWTPEARKAEADRLRNAPLWAAIVPKGEEGSLYRQEVEPPTPLERYGPSHSAPPQRYEPPPPRPKAFRTEPPTEVVRESERYYAPVSPQEVADRMVEVYGEDGLKAIYQSIMEARESEEWIESYDYYASGEGGEPPDHIIESPGEWAGDGDKDKHEIEWISNFFNIPFDYLMSWFIGDDLDTDENMERWGDLKEAFLDEFFMVTVPEAWGLIYPGLPGIITVGYNDSMGSAIVMQYIEVPEGGASGASQAGMEEEAEEEIEEEGEEAPPPPPPTKKRKKKGKKS